VGVSYDADPREVTTALLEAAKHPHVLDAPEPSVLFVGFGDSSLDFDLLVWTVEPGRMPVLESELRYRIWDALAEHGIEIPFPQQDIHVRSGIPWDTLVRNAEANREEGTSQ